METRSPSVVLFLAGLAAVAAVAGCARRTVVVEREPAEREVIVTQAPPQREVIVVQQPTEPPPPPRTEIRTASPGPGYVWHDGAYEWRDGRWVWVPGRWVRTDHSSAGWTTRRWDLVSGGAGW